MNKKLLRSVREYKKQSVLAPILVILEVLMEVLIPLEMAKIIDVGIANGDMSYIIQRGVILVAMAMLSLFFGVQAGNMAAVAAAGYAKNLRHDIFYKVQDFSFKNIDHFSTSGLVTRLTTDITNVQQAYMMSIRLLARAPFMIILSWIMTLTINKPIAMLFLIVVPVLGGTLIFIAKNAPDLFGSLIATGIFAHIALQVILNIAVVTGLLPTTGITLPFISYGGTSVLFLLGEMGLALSVSRDTD